jgi:predicted nucleic acid-binding protein
MSFDCVADASVGIKLLLLEPLSDQADALFAHLTDDPPARFYVPDLFFIECTNILWKYVHRFDYPLERAHQDVSNLTGLPLRTVLTGELVDEALEVAVTHGITAYDAAYVALARRLSLPLVTADESLVCCLAGASFDVRWLGEWP